MSHTALQRTIVRLLFDPAFVARLAADPEAALAGAGLEPRERRWLAEADPRAFGVDGYRRTRTLRALLEEHAATAALVCADAGAVRALERFFSDDAFHAAIAERRSLAGAFGAWLLGLARTPEARAVGRLEALVARVRRGTPRPWPEGAALRVPPTVGSEALPAGAVAAWQAVVTPLRQAEDGPVAALLAPSRAPARARVDERETVCVLAVATGGDVALSDVSEPLHDLLRIVGDGAPEADALAHLAAEGLDAVEAAELVSELVGDGLLERRP
ncbi:MAG: hypothetical protein H6745_14955 [Deltaproteobacteria bacterium]|nr:hypothetical protein [Deltaproteobacteria bacterium]